MTPENLDELDRRVYDLAVKPMPLAELAVRLGVPTAQADEKLQRLYRRLGVDDRAGLRALAERPLPAAQAPAVEPAEYVIGADAEYVIGADAETIAGRAGSIKRRSVLAAGLLAGTAAFGAGAAALRARGRYGGTAAAPQSETMPTPPAPAPGSFPVEVSATADGRFATRTWDASEPIEWRHGIFFMSNETGQVTGYQAPGPADGTVEWRDYRSLGDGRFVTAVNERAGRAVLFDRLQPGRSWSWSHAEYQLQAAFAPNQGTPVSAVFMGAGEGGRAMLRFVSLDTLGGEEVAAFEVPSQGVAVVIDPRWGGAATALVQEPRGSRFAFIDGSFQSPEIRLLQASVGAELARIPLRPNPTGKDAAITLRTLRLSEGGFTAYWQTATNGRGDLPIDYYSWPFGWDGTPRGPQRKSSRRAYYAPNAGFFSIAETVFGESTVGGVRVPWTSVELSRESLDGAAFRLRSSALGYGDELPPGRWLADSSAFVAAVRAGGFGEYGYALVPTDGTAITMLPRPPEGPASLEFDTWADGPAPSPFDPALFSFGRTRLYNARTNRWYAANLASGLRPAVLDPWSAGDQEMVFALPGLTRLAGQPPLMLAPKFERPPFSDDFEFRVDVDSEGLNVRQEPRVTSDVVALLHNGERLTGDNAAVREGAMTWLHVRTQGGIEGWVNSYWLAWA